ncbi:hypothetical protein [Streptomyces sp. ODS28]|uniref:hypothetical protein n=1 Tax=Streptomyces sp. ODS28 TaxID=3136688 RepID=UPI0031E9CF9A
MVVTYEYVRHRLQPRANTGKLPRLLRLSSKTPSALTIRGEFLRRRREENGTIRVSRHLHSFRHWESCGTINQITDEPVRTDPLLSAESQLVHTF